MIHESLCEGLAGDEQGHSGSLEGRKEGKRWKNGQ